MSLPMGEDGMRWGLRSVPAQTILWFCDLLKLWQLPQLMLFAHSSHRDLTWIQMVPLIEVGVIFPKCSTLQDESWLSWPHPALLQEQELRRAQCPTPGEGRALVTGLVWGQKWESQMPCWGVCQAVPFSAKQRLPKVEKSLGDAGCGPLCLVNLFMWCWTGPDLTGFPFYVCSSRPFVWLLIFYYCCCCYYYNQKWYKEIPTFPSACTELQKELYFPQILFFSTRIFRVSYHMAAACMGTGKVNDWWSQGGCDVKTNLLLIL